MAQEIGATESGRDWRAIIAHVLNSYEMSGYIRLSQNRDGPTVLGAYRQNWQRLTG